MPTPSSVDVATLAAKTLADALPNRSPAAPFYTVGDDTIRALTDLLHLFTTAITPTVAPIPANTSPTFLIAPYPRAIASPALAPVVTSPDLSLRAVPVSTPPLSHLIPPDDDEPVPR